MNTSCFRGLAAALGLAALAAPLGAQSVLCLKHDGKLEVIRRAEGDAPLVLEAGKWSRHPDAQCVLEPTAEYVPVVITVADPTFRKGQRAISDRGVPDARLVHAGRFVFNATLEAPRALDNVVLMLALVSDEDVNRLYLWGLGHLEAHKSRRVSIDVITPARLVGVRLHGFHLFVDGKEALHSHMPEARRAAALNRIVASRIAAAANGAARPLMLVDPVYPATLNSRVRGRAVVDCRVDAQGVVLEPVVKEATDPAFGVAAMEAVRQWRFVPAVKDGVATESRVEVPFDFGPSS